MIVKIKTFRDGARVPEKAHESDFAYDVYAASEEEVAPNVWKYGLGFGLQAVYDHRTQLTGFTFRPRSSVWKTGMVLSNSVGTIDDGYTGEISAVFYHVMPNMPRYKVGDKIGQIYLDGTGPNLDFMWVKDLDETERGEGGYGSTGR